MIFLLRYVFLLTLLLHSAQAYSEQRWTIYVDEYNRIWSVLEEDMETSKGNVLMKFKTGPEPLGEVFQNKVDDSLLTLNILKRYQTANLLWPPETTA